MTSQGEEEKAAKLGRHTQPEVQTGPCGCVSHSSPQGGSTSCSPAARSGGNPRSQGKLAGDKRAFSLLGSPVVKEITGIFKPRAET